MGSFRHILNRSLIVLGAVFVLLAIPGVSIAQNVTQGYQTDQQLQTGMLVRLDPNDGTKIQALRQADGKELLGVVVSSSDAPVSLSNPGVDQEVFVASYGRYDALVSNQNGKIKTGDYISISSIAGIGMKADDSQEMVIGKALKDFDGNGDSIGTSELKGDDGSTQRVSLGRIAVDISVAHNPFYNKDVIPGVPRFLERLAQAVTERPLSAFRIYASVAVILLCLIVAGVILFAGVRSGMIAIGRNPLAKKSISRNMVQVILSALIVFVIGLIAVYLLLRA